MKIGIDIDGVLTNIEAYQIDVSSKYFYEKEKRLIKNIKAYSVEDMFETDQEVDLKFWEENLFEYVQSELPRRFASEVIKKLKEEGNEIYIITARTSDSRIDSNVLAKKMKDLTIEWLNKYEIPYDKIFFAGSDKVPVCHENNIDVMIEDKPKNIMDIQDSGIKVICYHNEYNEQCEGDNIIRGYSWYDIYAKIKEGRI